MSIITHVCPHCSNSVQLPSNLVGKQGKCPGCGSVVTISATILSPPTAPPQQPQQQQPLPQQPQQYPPQQQPPQQQPQQYPPQQQPPQQQPQQYPPQQQYPQQQPPVLREGTQRSKDTVKASTSKTAYWAIGGLVVLVLIIAIPTVIFFMSTNGDSSLIIVNADGENVEVPPAPRSLEEVGELWLKALKAAESSERNGLAILSTLTWKEDEIKLAFEGYMRTDSPIPLAELTEAKERELFLRFSEDLKNSPNGWRKILNVEKVAFSRNTSSWTHRVLTRVKWSEMKLLATVKSREPRISDDFGGLKMHSIVLYLTNGDELFWLWLDEAFQVDAVGEKWFYGDDLRNGRLRKGGTKSNYVDFVLKELRKRDDSSLSKLISTLETLTPSGERRESSESVPPTESEILAALQIAKNEQFQKITLSGVPLTTKILSQLQEIPSITVLSLSNSQLVDVDMIQLVGLKNLKHLYLRDNLLTESGIKHLSKMVSLEYLYLGNNPLGNKAIDYLVKMKNLRTLALDNTRVSPRGRAGLRNSLPDCSILPDP